MNRLHGFSSLCCRDFYACQLRQYPDITESEHISEPVNILLKLTSPPPAAASPPAPSVSGPDGVSPPAAGTPPQHPSCLQRSCLWECLVTLCGCLEWEETKMAE
ncbi:hypothetical protein ATANTOWER_030004 [Ataeniobius toweri]|uniref:Uncharacterized protein n=1 Tax=Ataeniobius toweri TaxID=208326 RepID=A0ABU7AS56_9TELE|nr:hypothetical protein [Ataeniobius toweri]